ncbi:MAG: hypothetical protein H6733_08480 [Alphaproteobacteria bacterium]|nr:hypothetical protein [Alphaproteobacteria bacterium]
MLTFTSSGIVPVPTTLQIRLGPLADGRVRAGAPVPARALTDAEVADNVHAFTERRRGPRTAPCTALVLSGWSAARLTTLPGLVAQARRWGVTHLTLHAPVGSDGGTVEVDAAVVPVRRVEDVPALACWRGVAHTTAVVPLEPDVVRRLDRVASTLAAACPDRVVFTWPFPPAGRPAPVHEVVTALDAVAAAWQEGGPSWQVKGLPPCLLGAHAGRAGRSRNRWYVDADHQGANALLFFPDVVRFRKVDGCRFCAMDGACDGVAAAWLDQGRTPPLQPLGPGQVPA